MNKYLDKIGLELYHDLLQTELSHLIDELSDVIYLLDITDTPPATCSAGDMYFNTTQNKIYTATDTNTWGSTGENPKNKIYINLNTSESYRWNGSSLVDLDNCIIEGYYNNDNFYTAPPITHDYVEIDGVKWATMNLGASAVTDTGLYYSWGDTQGYTASQVGSESGQKYFGWADYKYTNDGGSTITKYNSTDDKTILDNSDDAANTVWDGSWRMPTASEFQILGEAVTATWTDDYQDSGVAGMICVDKTDNSKILFFPACGYCNNGSIHDVNSYGGYWSSSLNSMIVQSAYRLSFASDIEDDGVTWKGSNYRYSGFPVRGIWDGPIPTLIIPTTKAIYIDKETNIPYRWTGSAYVPLTKEVDIISNQEILDLFGGSSIDPSENPSIITSDDVVNTTSDGIVPKTTAAVKYLQTDSQGVASWGDKPNYNYGEISYLSDNSTDYTINNSSATLSIDGTQPMQVVTTTTNITGITFSALPVNGHSCHLIITAASDLTVDIAHNATMITIDSTAYTTVCPKAAAIDTLEITAGGYVELDLLRVGTKIYVRGV